MLLLEHISDAIHSLSGNRSRTLLTALGITIGVASIVTILALSGGIMKIIQGQVSSLGGNIILVRPGASSSEFSANNLTAPNSQHSYGTSTLTEDDVDTISKLPGIKETAPLMVLTGSMKSKTQNLPNSLIIATTPGLADISGLKVRDGQFIDNITNENTAVIGSQLSIDLFGTDRPIGQTFTMRGQTFTIIGVLKRQNDPFNFNAIDFDNAAIIGLEAAKNFNRGRSQIQQIDIKAESSSNLPELVSTIEEQVSKNHSGEKDFSVVSGEEVAAPTNQLFVTFASVMTTIAMISLFVGGIGIMNIMLVGVAERTREIGLRKAVGASNRNIFEQFLVESLLISLVGGLAGYILGYFSAFVISRFFNFLPALSWEVALAAFGMSIAVGVVFGLYPAIRAARKDPIESLRHYH